MNQVFELTYQQHIHLASGHQYNEITAGYVMTEIEAKAWKAADGRNNYYPAKLDDDEMWRV